MDDAIQVIDALKSLARFIEVLKRKAAYTETNESTGLATIMATISLIERLAAEVERLTPKPMTIEGVARVLNEHCYDGANDWEPSELHHEYLVCSIEGHSLHQWESEAIAQRFLREKEAARA